MTETMKQRLAAFGLLSVLILLTVTIALECKVDAERRQAAAGSHACDSLPAWAQKP